MPRTVISRRGNTPGALFENTQSKTIGKRLILLLHPTPHPQVGAQPPLKVPKCFKNPVPLKGKPHRGAEDAAIPSQRSSTAGGSSLLLTSHGCCWDVARRAAPQLLSKGRLCCPAAGLSADQLSLVCMQNGLALRQVLVLLGFLELFTPFLTLMVWSVRCPHPKATLPPLLSS